MRWHSHSPLSYPPVSCGLAHGPSPFAHGRAPAGPVPMGQFLVGMIGIAPALFVTSRRPTDAVMSWRGARPTSQPALVMQPLQRLHTSSSSGQRPIPLSQPLVKYAATSSPKMPTPSLHQTHRTHQHTKPYYKWRLGDLLIKLPTVSTSASTSPQASLLHFPTSQCSL